MKILKSFVSMLIILCGVYASYLAFLSYEIKDWTSTGLYIAFALVLLCCGIVSLLFTLTKKPAGKVTTSIPITIREAQPFAERPHIAEDTVRLEVEVLSDHEIDDETRTLREEAVPSDETALIENTLEVPEVSDFEEPSEAYMQPPLPQEQVDELTPNIEQAVVSVPVRLEESNVVKTPPIVQPLIFKPEPIGDKSVEIKEDPKFLFGDWWVDEDGLYIDVRLISITGRKQQKILKKLALHAELSYHINSKNESIEIVLNKDVLGLIPELYHHSLLMYIQGVERITLDSIVKKRRDVVQCVVKIRFNDDLRSKLQKKLQQKTWQ